MKAKLLLATLLLLSPFTFSHAEDSAAETAANELIELVFPEQMFIDSFMVVFSPALDQLRSQGFEEAAVEQVRLAALELANKVAFDPDFRAGLVNAYTEEFTSEELHQLIDFYESDIGRKAITTMPALMQKGSVIGEQITTKYQADFQAKITAILSGE